MSGGLLDDLSVLAKREFVQIEAWPVAVDSAKRIDNANHVCVQLFSSKDSEALHKSLEFDTIPSNYALRILASLLLQQEQFCSDSITRKQENAGKGLHALCRFFI